MITYNVFTQSNLSPTNANVLLLPRVVISVFSTLLHLNIFMYLKSLESEDYTDAASSLALFCNNFLPPEKILITTS